MCSKLLSKPRNKKNTQPPSNDIPMVAWKRFLNQTKHSPVSVTKIKPVQNQSITENGEKKPMTENFIYINQYYYFSSTIRCVKNIQTHFTLEKTIRPQLLKTLPNPKRSKLKIKSRVSATYRRLNGQYVSAVMTFQRGCLSLYVFHWQFQCCFGVVFIGFCNHRSES